MEDTFECRDFFWKGLGPDNWSFLYPSVCNFCQELAEYRSNFVELKSCKCCLNLLWTSQLDSLKSILNQVFRTWMDIHLKAQLNNLPKQHICYTCYNKECVFNKMGFTYFFTEEDYLLITNTYIHPQHLKSLNSEESDRLVTSPFDLIKINSLLNNTDDFSISAAYIDYISVYNWIPFQDGQCSFCNNPEVIKKNEHYNLLGCKSCIQELIDDEVDIDDPQDHPLSQKIYEILCDFVQKNYFLVVKSNLVFSEYFIEHNTCYSCGNQIENCKVAVFGKRNALAHRNCVSETGFVGLLTDNDFKEIISNNFEGIYW